MSEKKQLNEEQLEKVTGGDELEDAAKMAAEDASERALAELQEQIEEMERHKEQRTSGELENTYNTMLDLLKKLIGQDDGSDGQLHIG